MNQQTNLGTALITGASAGIGATYAQRLAARGHDLILVARDAARLQQLAEQLKARHGVQVEVLPADLTKRADLLTVEQRLRTDAAITLLLNNAGMAVQGQLIDTDIDRVESMIQLNVISVTRLAAAAAAAFGGRGSGTIINIASVLALAPELFNGVYSGTKAYVLNLSQSMQQELAPRGVRVQAVLPGATRTEIWDRAGGSVDDLPAEMLMEVGDLVDAALSGLDQGELVTIPSLPARADWDALQAARQALGPNLSRNRPADRYLVHAG
ncbi:SDR family NAD(P)-dependent oxidoreductase [Herbaspirillum sp. alder98]|uniref:SDR family NAD(P)-dependent oxidoreductase n=1 Tax=Herbaspirillum sp. alder98 TaxID=2913096 RepID=UPI001CD90960|nr:SDR family oxidoreductase [Herbaspirillum sp. alder98]MCA1326517.1 SDR family oxidoreductase [Herbaspirillum sp. alder98]